MFGYACLGEGYVGIAVWVRSK